MRRRRPGSRSKRYKRRLPGVLGWSLGVLVGLAALVAIAYVHGKAPDAHQDFLASLHTTLAKPAVAGAVAFAAVLVLAWGVRHLLLEFLAWWPGRIIVGEFVADPEVEGADVARLTAEFRERLVRSHLQSPAPVPAPAQQGDFLDVLTNGTVDPGNPLASLLSVVRAARPTHAYEVKGALVTREAAPGCGVTVHVVRLPGKAGPGQTFWDSSWDAAIRRAADHATASILPRTRLCRSPWSGWRGFHLPSKLFHCYERAAELERERRYDEALDLYYKALEQDPMNLGLRLQIGFLQEKLALFVDALATYESILEVARPGRNAVGAESGDATPAAVAADNPPDLVLSRRSRRDRLRRFHRSPARLDRERVLLVARYRRATLMGGQELPRQWAIARCGAQPNRRDDQRSQLRERLRPALREIFEEAEASPTVAWLIRPIYDSLDAGKGAGSGGRRRRSGRLRRSIAARVLDAVRPRASERLGRADLKSLLAEPEADVLRDDLRLQLEELLVRAALHDLSELRAQLPVVRRSSGLSRDAVDLAGLWMQERLRRILPQLVEGAAPALPVSAEQLRRTVRRIEGRLRGFTRWQEHYNAACIYALPLLARTARPEEAEVRALSGLAVERLEKAIACADSGYVASRRDWLLSDDPDLDGLRAEPPFKRFEAMFFPAAARTPKRPRDLHKWEVSRYTFELLSATAERWERTWRRRKGSIEPAFDVHDLVQWCDVELAAWKRVREVAVNRRHWQSRMALVEDMRRWGTTFGFAPVEVRFPRFTEADARSLDGKDGGPNNVAAVVEHNDDLLETLAETIERPGGCRLITELDARHADLARLDLAGGTLRPDHAARLCESHAGLWRALRRYLEAGDDDLHETLEDAIRETAAIWVLTERRRRRGDLAGKRSNGLRPRALRPSVRV